ncbi:MAG TPA: alpha-L-rhamnosidase, partial [Caulobacteraceae bacterium]|nr:alpha-L-rhamnosidase [Caulobacteraceae bacterium]
MALSAADETVIEGLQVEGLTNPLGLEQARPRLAWRMTAARPGARQSAYRVRVTRGEGAVRAGAADLWDSGRIESGRSFDVTYGGPALTSCERVWWTVDVWDETGAMTSAEPAWWEMGLLEAGDWSASWLAAETDEDRADRQAGLNWIWAETEDPLEPHRFRYRFTTDADAP